MSMAAVRILLIPCLLGIVVATLPGFCLAGGIAAGPNLVANPSFESPGDRSGLPDRWWGSDKVYSRSTAAARTGKASLKYANADAGVYRLCSQSVPVRAGWKCRFSVYVKTDRIAGKDSGASICLEWSDKDGKWLGGSYPHGVKGTTDWTRVEGVTRVPSEAARFSLTCYVRKGMTGTAWFDDVELVRVSDPPMRTMLLTPVYRGRISGDPPANVRVRVRLGLRDHDLRPTQVKVAARIVAPGRKGNFGQAEIEPRDAKVFDLDLDLTVPVKVKKLRPGKYRLLISLIGPDGKVLQTVGRDLVRTSDDFKPTCRIDEHRRLIVDGKPFFPIGMYWSRINARDLKVYSDSRFNCLMPYGRPTIEEMDLAQRHGLKVIYSIKDFYAGSRWSPKDIRTAADEEAKVRATVRRFRGHPALLAWYLNDELPQSYMPRLAAHWRWTAREDPNHPAWVVLYQYREVGDYVDTFDVIGTDPYPIGRKPASMAGRWTAETHRQVGGARPMWQVPQLHNWANYGKTPAEKKAARTPTRAEVRSMAWQCICEGATGLVFYSWYDVKRNPDVSFEKQWAYLKEIAAEIDSAAPMLLSTEPAAVVKARTNPAEPRWLHWLVRSHKGRVFIFAVNNGDAKGTAAFTIDRNVRNVRTVGEDRAVKAEGNSFRDTFEKLQVRIYEVKLGDTP